MPIHLPKKREREREQGDSERNELSPGATCLAICITLQILQRAFGVYGMRAEEVEKRKGKKKTGGFKLFYKIDFCC